MHPRTRTSSESMMRQNKSLAVCFHPEHSCPDKNTRGGGGDRCLLTERSTQNSTAAHARAFTTTYCAYIRTYVYTYIHDVETLCSTRGRAQNSFAALRVSAAKTLAAVR